MRGQSKFTSVLGTLDPLKGPEHTTEWVARLRTAALRDETAKELNGVLQAIHFFTGPWHQKSKTQANYAGPLLASNGVSQK